MKGIYTYFSIFLMCLVVSSPAKSQFASLDHLVEQAIIDKIFPGAVILVGHKGTIAYHKAFGNYTYDKNSPRITTKTVFDIASLTKVIATTTLVMLLVDAQKISLEDSVSNYLPYFADGSRAIRIKHLLTHTSGLTDGLLVSAKTKQELAWILERYKPTNPLGNHYLYADSNMLIMQKIIEKMMGAPLNVLVSNYITKPLGMQNTEFNPHNKTRCAPTTTITQGLVHDPRAQLLNGVAGHAGLFSTTEDLAKFMTMLLNNGYYTYNLFEKPLIKSETVTTWTQKQNNFNRGYGWEIGRHISPEAFGHFGWTGTSIWADKKLSLFCIVLTNRTYPDDTNFAIRSFRTKFHNAIMSVIQPTIVA